MQASALAIFFVNMKRLGEELTRLNSTLRSLASTVVEESDR